MGPPRDGQILRLLNATHPGTIATSLPLFGGSQLVGPRQNTRLLVWPLPFESSSQPTAAYAGITLFANRGKHDLPLRR